MELKSYGIEAINSDQALEYLNEARIYSDNVMYIGVFGDVGSNFQDDPYIKVYNNISFTAATKVARISLFHLKYIYHRDSKQVWYLNGKELKHINHIMKERDKTGLTYWDRTLIEIAKKSEKHDFEYYKKRLPEAPDFTEVKR